MILLHKYIIHKYLINVQTMKNTVNLPNLAHRAWIAGFAQKHYDASSSVMYINLYDPNTFPPIKITWGRLFIAARQMFADPYNVYVVLALRAG